MALHLASAHRLDAAVEDRRAVRRPGDLGRGVTVPVETSAPVARSRTKISLIRSPLKSTAKATFALSGSPPSRANTARDPWRVQGTLDDPSAPAATRRGEAITSGQRRPRSALVVIAVAAWGTSSSGQVGALLQLLVERLRGAFPRDELGVGMGVLRLQMSDDLRISFSFSQCEVVAAGPGRVVTVVAPGPARPALHPTRRGSGAAFRRSWRSISRRRMARQRRRPRSPGRDEGGGAGLSAENP